tara:strand:- start:115 stop:669 length:555 start_codon:yes stop_codon:yes gene_type:complete
MNNKVNSPTKFQSCTLLLDFDKTLAIRDISDDYIVKLYTEFQRNPSNLNRAALKRAVFGSDKRINEILIPLLSINRVEYIIISANIKYYIEQVLEASNLRIYFRYIYGSVDEKGKFVKRRFKGKLDRVVFVDDYQKYIDQMKSVLPIENIFKVPRPKNKQLGIQKPLLYRLLKKIHNLTNNKNG